MKEMMIECNNYFGEMSEDRCRTVEEYIKEKIKDHCELNKVAMKEIQIQDNLIQPTLTIRYNTGETQSLIELIDEALIEIGVAAIKIVVSKIVSRAVEGALAGGGTGLVAGKSTNPVATTLIGALIGGLVGSAIEKRITEYVATKNSGNWIFEKIKVSGAKK
ncbi:MAG: hypothetical protein CO032_04325 [Nitrosopumilales archaeon CG_4_9_14_0_2_um_filter_34_16]|nr:MAG: hypothetical protein CO032_04325 [Nitrosopumilales archaeon CG_4_9_14_0_2_um_filter_34_16]